MTLSTDFILLSEVAGDTDDDKTKGRMSAKDRLAKFKADRAAKKALEKARTKQPFRVGVYKLDGNSL
jgi:hypothetical protein